MNFTQKISVTIAVLFALSANPAFAKAKAKKAPRIPANAEHSIDVDESGEVKVNGQAIDIVAGKKPLALMSARIVNAIPTGMSEVPAFRLEPLELHTRETPDGKTTVSKLNASIQTLQADTSWMFYHDSKMGRGSRFEPQFPMSMHDLRELKGKIVVFPVGEGSTAEKVNISWNECAGVVTGNYADGKDYACTAKRVLNDEYAGYMRDHLMTCVNAGMAKAGLDKGVKVHLVHNGTGPDAAHKKTPSLHNAGRAVDIQRMVVTTASGSHTFDFKKTNTNRVLGDKCAPAGSDNCQYWEEFRSCWHSLMKARACPKNKNPKRRWIGSLGWEDKKHIAHHLHMSYPFCPKAAGHWTTSFGDDEEGDFEMFEERDPDEGIEI